MGSRRTEGLSARVCNRLLDLLASPDDVMAEAAADSLRELARSKEHHRYLIGQIDRLESQLLHRVLAVRVNIARVLGELNTNEAAESISHAIMTTDTKVLLGTVKYGYRVPPNQSFSGARIVVLCDAYCDAMVKNPDRSCRIRHLSRLAITPSLDISVRSYAFQYMVHLICRSSAAPVPWLELLKKSVGDFASLPRLNLQKAIHEFEVFIARIGRCETLPPECESEE